MCDHFSFQGTVDKRDRTEELDHYAFGTCELPQMPARDSNVAELRYVGGKAQALDESQQERAK